MINKGTVKIIWLSFFIVWFLLSWIYLFKNKESLKTIVDSSENSKVSLIKEPYKPLDNLKEIEDISKIPDTNRQIISSENGSIKEFATITLTGKSYSGIITTQFWEITKKGEDLILIVNQKTASGSDSSGMPIYKDETKEIKMNLADSLILDDKRILYNINKDDLKINSKYEVQGIEILNPSNPEDKAFIFYKFTPEDVKIKNEKLLNEFAKERDEILSKGWDKVAEQLRDLNIKYWFSKK